MVGTRIGPLAQIITILLLSSAQMPSNVWKTSEIVLMRFKHLIIEILALVHAK